MIRFVFSLVIATVSLFAGEGGGKTCVVFVCDQKYYHKFQQSYAQLINEGMYTGDVCLIATGRLRANAVRRRYQNKGLIVKTFPVVEHNSRQMTTAMNKRTNDAKMQKFNVFQTYFKQWDTILYIDCGMSIHGDVNKIIALREKDTMLAHSNCYPTYEWQHEHEFIDDGSEAYRALHEKYDLYCDYFQSTMMLFDTSLIAENTFENIKKLRELYPIGKGDQCYIALYFCHEKPAWKQIALKDDETYFYDFFPREIGEKYIMHKYRNRNFPCPKCR